MVPEGTCIYLLFVIICYFLFIPVFIALITIVVFKREMASEAMKPKWKTEHRFCVCSCSQSNSKTDREFALHPTDLDSTPGTSYDPELVRSYP